VGSKKFWWGFNLFGLTWFLKATNQVTCNYLALKRPEIQHGSRLTRGLKPTKGTFQVHPNPLEVTFLNAVSELKAQSSNVSFARLSFER
jgi:hypothetical protein